MPMQKKHLPVLAEKLGRGRSLGASARPASPPGVPSQKRGGGGGGANGALVALILAAFAFSAATILVVAPSVARSASSASDLDGMGARGEGDSNRRSAGKNDDKNEDGRGADDGEGDEVDPTPPEGPRSSMSDLITWMLSERGGDAGTQHSAAAQMNDSPPATLEFVPGTLSLSHAQTLSHCHADPRVYGKHVQGRRGDGSAVPVSFSEKHRLAYVMLPKSGSSTARHMLKDKFHAREGSKPLKKNFFERGERMDGWEVVSFVRDPLSRFFSQYDEAYVRTAPWQKGENIFYANPDIKGRNIPHPFPYLFENIHTYQDYEDVFCPTSTRKSRKECIFRQSKENGTLASRFERFVREYDGRDPFDVHLTLQVPMMSSTDGAPLHMTQIYNTTDSEGGWGRIASQFLGGKDALGKGGLKVIAGRSYPRRFDSGLVSEGTRRRICELTLLDYCCLNLPLPSVCEGEHYLAGGDDSTRRGLFCVLDRRGRIQPGIFPDKRKG